MKKLDYGEGPMAEVVEIRTREGLLNTSDPYDISFPDQAGFAGITDDIVIVGDF